MATANNSKYKDEDWLYRQYWAEPRGVEDIADECDVSQQTISYWMDKFGIETRDAPTIISAEQREKLNDVDWLSEKYIGERKTAGEIADELDVGKTTVVQRMDEHGIERRDPSESKLPENAAKKLRDKQWLQKRYSENRQSAVEIADDLGVSDVVVGSWLDRHGIHTRDISESRLPQTASEKLQDEDWLKARRKEDRASTYTIAEELGVSAGAVGGWLKRHGLDPRLPGLEPLKYYGPSWADAREERLEKDNFRCQSCGDSSDTDGICLDIHHIRPLRDFQKDNGQLNHETANRIENLVTLCRSCHQRWEGIPLRPKLLS